MACSSPNMMGYDPINGYRFLGPRWTEKHVQDLGSNTYNHIIDIPCGKCELCRVDRRYTRAIQIMLEAEMHPESTYFFTLTYDEKHHTDPELNHDDWAQFMKNFRQTFCQAKYCLLKYRGTKRQGKESSLTFKKIKQVMTGEYGDQFGRKHFHGIVFNHCFFDLVSTGTYSEKGHEIFTSPSLEKVWGKGIVQVSKVTFDLALYVSAYVTDPMDSDTDENLHRKKKQYGRFGAGIGLDWLKLYWKDVLVKGKISTFEGDQPIPRMFLKKIEEWHPKEFREWKEKKFLAMLEKKEKLIEKGDGPLRRAHAKGAIFNHNRLKRKKDQIYAIEKQRVASRTL